MRSSDALERLSLPLALVVVVAGAITIYPCAILYRAARQEATSAERVVLDTSELLSSLKDAETGQRGYLLTGRDSYLEPYRRSLDSIRHNLALLKKDVARPANLARLPRLEQLVRAKLVELEMTIELRGSLGLPAAMNVVTADDGKRTMDEIRRLCAEIDQTVRVPMLAAQQAA